jgi:hypothetical protein
MRFRTHVVRRCILLLAYSLSIGVLFAAPTAKLANGSNSLVVTADVEAPRISGLATASGSAWKGKHVASLIDHATVGGIERQLKWHFNAPLFRTDRRSISFVYDAVGVALRLTWEWQVRANHGPLEHSVRIQNRTGAEVWLPLQDSLDIAWTEFPQDKIEQLWTRATCCGDGCERF